MRSRKRIEVNLEELDQIIDRGQRARLSESDGHTLKSALHTPWRKLWREPGARRRPAKFCRRTARKRTSNTQTNPQSLVTGVMALRPSPAPSGFGFRIPGSTLGKVSGMPAGKTLSPGGASHAHTLYGTGADDYVTKPYSPKELRARIRALLRRTSHEVAGEGIVRFGDCEVDFIRAELRRAGKPVPTTPLEFKLIGLFARRPGRVLTRQALIDEAWGKETAITERVVDNQIANLRKKIESSPARSDI